MLERKLRENKIPLYPEQARVVKLLDGLKLDERATSGLLLAAGNRYDMKSILESIRIQYPPGMAITGIPKGLASLSTRISRCSFFRASSYQSSTSTSGSRRGSRPNRGSKWTHWQTEWDDSILEAHENPDDYEEDDLEVQGEDHDGDGPNDGEGDENWDEEEEELVPDAGDQADGQAAAESDVNALLECAQALTVTSKKLAGLVHATTRPMRRARARARTPKESEVSMVSARLTAQVELRARSAVPTASQWKHGAGNIRPFMNVLFSLKGSLCLGCGSPDHWVRDCPHVLSFQAPLASADVELDPEGTPVNWMTTVQTFEPTAQNIRNFAVPRLPSVLLGTCTDASFL